MDQATEVEDLGWFRHDNRMRHDPKIRALNDTTYRLWNALMEIASELQLHGVVHFLPGVPLSEEQWADEAKIPAKAVRPGLEALQRFLMIEMRSDCVFVTNFARRQYQSDVSTGRVKAFRERQKQPIGNGDETFQERPGNDDVTPPDTDTDTDENNVRSRDKRTSDYSSEFEEFWTIYPKTTNKKGAFGKWKATLHKNADVSPPRLITCARNYADACRRQGTEERYKLHAATFLGPTERWREFEEPIALVKSDFTAAGRPAEDDVARQLRELEEQKHGDPH